MASVVCRPKTTVSRAGSAPTNAPTSSRARSYEAVLNRDLAPVPRCTLEYLGRNSATASSTDRSAGVVAALSTLTYLTGGPPSTGLSSSMPMTSSRPIAGVASACSSVPRVMVDTAITAPRPQTGVATAAVGVGRPTVGVRP